MSKRRRTPSPFDSQYSSARELGDGGPDDPFWRCAVMLPDGETHLQLGLDEIWRADGPGGSVGGSLQNVLTAVAGVCPTECLEVVVNAVRYRRAIRAPNAIVRVEKMTGRWFHASRAVNRESIALHGLDWRRKRTVPGIAGSAVAEREGVFLCRTLTDAVWFAGMAGSESVDIWAAQLEEVWLEADAGGGVDMGWAICHQPIPPAALELEDGVRGFE